MSTPAAVNLPIELILLAAEYAAQLQTSEKAIRRWRHWVASLCTVCRALEPAMARILYTLVHVHPGNIDVVVRAAEMDTHPFRRARAVYLDTRGGFLADEQASALSAAFQHVHAYTGSLHDLRSLLNDQIHSHDIRPLSVHFLLSWKVFDLGIVTISAERLHVVFEQSFISNDDLSRFRTRFLILDVHTATSDEAIDTVRQALRVQTLERILVRPFVSRAKSQVQDLRDRFRSFAHAERSAIIWFDDSFPSDGRSVDLNVAELLDYRGLSDAMTGDDLWLQGSQLYIPGNDA
ncbi:hypothetical protein EXIGLDRAFT_759237 [Exidia glandulosa HHB12029]|uniref:F-box domain-containing protein n=1 Tax=Exidia glandulosa HHB12029 TaxID=1314781 RepID=A0A165QBQ4_EXIGL|nr:hypothetical protein EXIGLDRAFT_759237 [Exidia glandulosa HHB12029]